MHEEPRRVFLSKSVGGRDAGVERQGRQLVCVFLKGIPDWAFKNCFISRRSRIKCGMTVGISWRSRIKRGMTAIDGARMGPRAINL
ncbi:MAG: hypothetical protein DHS20C10_12440 [marine bacterium B5-7]|nr:MAG: hypothetical protein DHS20C10_12440 [marine bacterium B5-7]